MFFYGKNLFCKNNSEKKAIKNQPKETRKIIFFRCRLYGNSEMFGWEYKIPCEELFFGDFFYFIIFFWEFKISVLSSRYGRFVLLKYFCYE